MRNKSAAVAALLLGSSSLLATELPPAAPASDWSFSISPYVWVAAVKVETSLDSEPTPPTPAPPGADKYETELAGGALLAAQVHYKSFGLWFDFVWVRTDTNALQSGPFYSAKQLETDFYHSTLALSYRMNTPENFHVELLAGVRYWSIEADVSASAGTLPAFKASTGETWVTPIIGLDLQYDVNSKWSLMLKGTVGVADDNSDGWEMMGGVAYRFGQHWSTALGYRYLHEEYTRKRFSYLTNVSGAVLGVSYRF